MAATCPNIRSKEWQALVAKIGVFESFREFVKNGGVIPNADNYKETFKGTNATLKIFDALTNKKIQGFYDRFYKSMPEKFYSEVIPIAGKVQTDLLRDYNNRNNPQTLNDMISGILSEMSFTVETKVASSGEYTTYDDLADHITDPLRHPKPEFQYSVINQEGKTVFQTDSLKEAEDKATELNKKYGVYEGSYSDMTVPGGTNYRNNEIRTPDITPSIKGHAAFSTDQGIGWFRSDDLVTGQEGIYEESYDLPFANDDKYKVIKEGDITKTRRILEVQSDLFQKGRGYSDLINSHKNKNQPIEENIRQNNFLQLLNKENNWVTFFVKSIIQDSARLGYERVLFPGGDTAAKVEGHQTLEGFIQGRERMIREAEETIRETNLPIEEVKNFTVPEGDFFNENGKYYYVLFEDEHERRINTTKEFFEEKWNESKEAVREASIRQKEQFERELERARGPEGMGAFSAIAKFYQTTVQNILKKQGYNPLEITDEHGNKWFEVNINAERDSSTIFLQRGEKPTITPTPASPSTLKKIREFLDRIGVSITGTDAIIYNNQKLDANGISYPLQQLIEVVHGKEDIALTEEAMHMAVELVEQKNPSLFKQMMDRIGSYNLYQEVFNEYKNFPLYQTNGRPDVPKIKKEAIGKVLAQTVINLNEGTNDKPELLVQTRSWWQKIIDFLKALFNRAGFNPFEEAAAQVLSGENIGTFESTPTKKGVNELFNNIPQLSEIGTPGQYSAYLDTIFPNSKVNNIVYHGTPHNYENILNEGFRITKKESIGPKDTKRPGVWFFEDRINAQMYEMDVITQSASEESGVIASIINLNNPFTKDYNFKNFFGITNDSFDLDLKKYDGIIGYNVEEDVGTGTEYVVFKSEQIHILGSERDIERFREFVKGNPFLQVAGDPLFNKLRDTNTNVAKTGPDSFEINGIPIKRTIMTDVLDFYKKKGREESYIKFKKENENKIKQDIQDILDRYIDDNGVIRANPDPHINPSAVNPNDNTLYNTLESHLKDRLNTYPPGTRFLKGVNVYNGRNTAGNVDMIAVLPDNKVDIIQFKVPETGATAVDIANYRQEAYNIEIESIRRILQDGYGISRNQFRLTRAIPIRAFYNPAFPGGPSDQLDAITIGNVNIDLIQDDILLPIASISEVSGNEKFDKLINRLRGLARKLAEERVSPEKRFEKSQRVNILLASIRKLQIQGKADGIISSAKTIIKRQKDLYTVLKDKIDQIDTDKATIEELNRIAADILDEKDQVEIYKDLYRVFKEIYTDGSDESKRYLSETRDIAEDAQDALDQYWNLAADFRKNKFAQKVGIADALNPEKQLTWYRRMVRSLSQSQTKAGAILWELVKRINNLHQNRFRDRLFKLYELEGRVEKWLAGRNIQELYKKIFSFDDKGRWRGRIIPKYSKQFYDELEKAQASRDLNWINDNIDIAEYNKWYVATHQERIDDSKTARVHEDDAENAKIIQQNLQKYVDTFFIGNKRGITEANYKLKSFPKEKWQSAEYRELLKVENEPVLDLYNYWQDRLKESFESGMIQENLGRTWFPNVRRNLLEKLSTAKAGNKAQSIFGNLRIEAEDLTFGKIDPLTGKPIDEVHANFVSDLGEEVRGTDGKYFRDYSEKSMDIFKVIALWEQEIVKFDLRDESEALARLLYYTEAHPDRQALEVNRGGGIKRDSKTGLPILVSNEINAKYIKEHIDAVYYGKRLATESDVNIDIPYKAAVEKINKIFGREVFTVPETPTVTMSGVKAIEAMNRFFVAKTLGLNLFTAVAQWFGGTINTFINQGKYFDKKDLLEAEADYVSARFWGSEETKKIAGLLSYVHPYTEDRSEQAIRNLSVSGMVRYLSSDHLFYLQRGSDNWVNRIIAIAFFRNTMVEDGKLINIREYAKKELGHTNKYAGTYQESVDLERRIDKRVEELKKSPKALVNVAQIVNDRIVIPGITRDDETLINFRQVILEYIKNALGNTSREDLSLYKRQVMWQSFFMFKNWIPRMADVRFQSFKFNPGTNEYEYGRVRMLWNAVRHTGLLNVNSLLRRLSGDNSTIVEIAKKQYEIKRQKALEQEQDFDIDEAEFIDMYIKGVRSEFKELMLGLALMGILIAARLGAPDRDEDAEIKGAYKWMLRGLDKLNDEVNFFYNPASFTDIVNGSVFPAVSLLVDIQKFLTTSIMKGFYYAIGDEEMAEKQKASKYLFRVLPITKELLTYLAVFNDDLAKEYGVRLSTQHGAIR